MDENELFGGVFTKCGMSAVDSALLGFTDSLLYAPKSTVCKWHLFKYMKLLET